MFLSLHREYDRANIMQQQGDDDDDVFEILPVVNNACRQDLYVARTRLRAPSGDRYDFWGLFCHNDIPVGAFIGMYSGMWIHADAAFPFANRHALEVNGELSVAPPGQRPDPQRYPIAMANEPAPRTFANATLREWEFDSGDIEVPHNVSDNVFHGAGLVACLFIPRNTEIKWHYGRSYGNLRNYPAGEDCQNEPPALSSAQVRQALGHRLPYDSVSPPLGSPSASDDEEADPTYGRSYKNNGNLRILQLVHNLNRFMCADDKKECQDVRSQRKLPPTRCDARF